MAKKKNKRIGIVYSSDPDFDYDYNNQEEIETLAPEKQQLKVQLDRRKRKGKTVTLITGFIGHPDDLKALGKILKSKCGVGGSAKNGEIIIQGEFKTKIADLLTNMDYKVKMVGG